MKDVIIRQATRNDIPQIIDLQIENHIQNIPKEDRDIYGFVTLLTSSTKLLMCIEENLVFVAHPYDFQNQIIGYIILMRPGVAYSIEFLKPLIEQSFNLLEKKPTQDFESSLVGWGNYLILAQILVSKKHANQKIGTRLLQKAEEKAGNHVKYIFTEVSNINKHSLNFHLSGGFKKKLSYECAGQTFYIINKEF